MVNYKLDAVRRGMANALEYISKITVVHHATSYINGPRADKCMYTSTIFTDKEF